MVQHLIVYRRIARLQMGTWKRKPIGWEASRAGRSAFGKTRKLAAAALRELEAQTTGRLNANMVALAAALQKQPN